MGQGWTEEAADLEEPGVPGWREVAGVVLESETQAGAQWCKPEAETY